jgi:hypothetical protein
MRREIAKYISECDICQRVKASHLKTAGTLQPLTIPSWKWEDISMDFIIGLPNTSRKHDSIWVIVDRLTKTAHFIPVFFSTARIGTNACHWQNFLIITAIRQALGWPHLKHYTVANAELL